MINNLDLFTDLIKISGISGFEDDITDLFTRELEVYFGSKVINDSYNNVFMEEKSQQEGPTILICCHLDEPGLIVKKVDPDEKKILFDQIGSLRNENLIGQKVSIATSEGMVQGFIDEKETDKFILLKKEADFSFVEVGYPVSFSTNIVELGKNRISGKSFDNRAGCYAILEMIKHLDLDQLKGTLQIAGFSKAELGLGGIIPLTKRPDHIIYVDAVESGDVPDSHSDINLGGGVVFPSGDLSGGNLLVSPKNLIKLRNFSIEGEIPHQVGSVYAECCLNTTVRNLYNLCPSISSILIPTRYHHSSVEMIDFNDVNSCISLLTNIVNV